MRERYADDSETCSSQPLWSDECDTGGKSYTCIMNLTMLIDTLIFQDIGLMCISSRKMYGKLEEQSECNENKRIKSTS